MITYITKYAIQFTNPTIYGDEVAMTAWGDTPHNPAEWLNGKLVTKQVLSPKSTTLVRKYMIKEKFKGGRDISIDQAIKELTA